MATWLTSLIVAGLGGVRGLFPAGAREEVFRLYIGGVRGRGCAVRTYLVVGCTRIARGEPVAGSVTGGEACGYPCSEKEGFTHRWLWRAPCFWGTHVRELHAVDTYEPAF